MTYFCKSFFCFLCWFLCATIAAQTSKIDSLEQILNSDKLKNPEKAELLIKLARAYLYEDSAKCRAYAMESLQLAQNSGIKLAEAKAYSALGNFYSVYQLPYLAHAYHINAEEIYLEVDDKESLYHHFSNLMRSFYDYREYENAAYYANKVLLLAIERKDWEMEMIARYVLGDSRFRDDFGQESLDYFLNLYHRSLQLDDSLQIKQDITITIAGRCARTYIRGMNRPDKALPYLYQIRASYLKNDFKPFFIFIYNELAEAHAMMHNIDSAEYYNRKAMDSERTINLLARVYYTKAKIDSLKGDYLSAMANYQKYHHISDSLAKEDASTEKARIKVWHEFDQKDLEKKFLQQEYQKERKMTLRLEIALVAILMLLFLTVFFYRKLTKTNHEMKELHKVKDKLFSVVAHDLRSPVSALVSILKLAETEQLNAEEKTQLFKDISCRVDNTHNLLENLLRWAKSQMQGIISTPVYFDVQGESRLVTDSLQEIAANKKIVLENRIKQQQVYADRDMFAVVIRNLTTNAIKYTHAGGEVILGSELSGDILVVSVKDTGTGMSQEVQDKLFKLSETKSQHGTDNESGAGLGLVMCADFVKANNGRIWYTSKQGEGSTFFFSVPVKNSLP